MRLARCFVEYSILLTVSVLSLPVLGNQYPKLSDTPTASAYHEAIERSHVYPVNRDAKNILWLYYKDMKFKNEWLDKDRILNEEGFYHAIRSFSGETCGLLWRYENGKPQKRIVGGVDVDHKLNTGKTEAVPFSSVRSPWHSSKYTIKYPTSNTTYSMFYMEGKRFDGQHIGFPIHRVGFFFGRSGAGLDRNSLVFSLNTHFIGSKDGVLDSTTLLQGDIALLTLVAVPFSVGRVKGMASEHDAFEQCYKTSYFILPHKDDV